MLNNMVPFITLNLNTFVSSILIVDQLLRSSTNLLHEIVTTNRLEWSGRYVRLYSWKSGLRGCDTIAAVT